MLTSAAVERHVSVMSFLFTLSSRYPFHLSDAIIIFLSFSFGGSAHRGLMKEHLIFRNVGLPGYNQKSDSLIESPDLQTKYVQSLWAYCLYLLYFSMIATS